MHLGTKAPRPLTGRQRRSIKIAVLALLLLTGISLALRFGYREMPAFVVGDEFEISSPVGGTVGRVHRQANETYRRGDELVTVTNEELAAQLAAVEHDLAEIDRSLAIEHSEEGLERRRFELQTAIAQSESDLESTRLEVGSVETLLPQALSWRDAAAERLRHGEELRAAEALTSTELDERRKSALESETRHSELTAKRQILAARAAKLEEILGLHRSRLDNLGEERTAFITELELKRREKIGIRDRLRSNLEELRLTADHDGIVTAVLRKEGEYVHSGGPILRVMRGENVWVEAYLKVAEKRFVEPGDVVKVRGQDLPMGSLIGRVSKVLPVLRPMPSSRSLMGRQENFAVLVITLDDGELARAVLSPAQHVTAQVRRRLAWPGDRAASAQP